MGKKVVNLYGTTPNKDVMTLEILSAGIYSVEIVFNTWAYAEMAKWSWCFEQTKGLVYMTDLSMKLPEMMGYKTARVYLRDFIMYFGGYWGGGKPMYVWQRSLEDYVLRPEALKKITTTHRQNNP